MSKNKTVKSDEQKQNKVLAELNEKELRDAVSGVFPRVRPLTALFELKARKAKNLAPLFWENRQSPDPDMRAVAIAGLGAECLPKNNAALLEALKDKSPQVIRRAAEALAKSGGAEELKPLRSLRPKNTLVKRAVDTSKTLLAYSLGESRGLLNKPDASELLELGGSQSKPIEIKPLSLQAEGFSNIVAEELPGWKLADQAHEIRCGQWNYLLMFKQEVIENQAAGLFQKSHVLGALLRRERCDNRFYLYAHLLAHSQRGKALNLFVMRNSGEVAFYGELSPAEDLIQFWVSAVNTRHTRPIEFSGAIDLSHSEATLNISKALVAEGKASHQPVPKKPRALQTPVS